MFKLFGLKNKTQSEKTKATIICTQVRADHAHNRMISDSGDELAQWKGLRYRLNKWIDNIDKELMNINDTIRKVNNDNI